MIKQTTVTAGSRWCLVVTLGLNPGQRCLHANPGIELDVGSSFEGPDLPIGRTTVTRRAPRHSAGLGVWVAPDGIPSGCAVFSTDLIMQQRFMDPQHQVIFQLWLELKLLVDDLRAFFRDLSDAIKECPSAPRGHRSDHRVHARTLQYQGLLCPACGG